MPRGGWPSLRTSGVTASQRVLGFQREYGDRAREQVRTHPLASVGIAFGVGVVLARLLMR